MAKDPSKTEAATPKRIRKARNEGNVAKSQEVSKTVSVMAGLAALMMWLGYIAKDLAALFRHFMTVSPTFELNEANLMSMGLWLMAETAKMVLPVLFIIAFCVFVSLRLQVGKLWTTKVFEFKLNRFNLFNGIKRMFLSPQTFIRLGKSLLQALCIGFAPWLVIKAEMPKLASLYYMDAAGVALYILNVGAKMTMYALFPMICISVFDWWYTRWDYAENLKMSKDEIKDERKQQEGDEKIKGEIRKKMMRMSARRMMQEVPKADVVITNPTHIAVALRYNAMEAPAPVVVAMGADNLALKIREIARENGVPIRENKPLARALYKQTEIGDMIPAELFQAVAIILAQIWKTRPPKHTKIP